MEKKEKKKEKLIRKKERKKHNVCACLDILRLVYKENLINNRFGLNTSPYNCTLL
jgi:hypothetical protein